MCLGSKTNELFTMLSLSKVGFFFFKKEGSKTTHFLNFFKKETNAIFFFVKKHKNIECQLSPPQTISKHCPQCLNQNQVKFERLHLINIKGK